MNVTMSTKCRELTGCTTARVREITPRSPLVAREWRLDNGAREVELKDQSNAGWEEFCRAEVAKPVADTP